MTKQLLILLFAGIICGTCLADEPNTDATAKKHDKSEPEVLSGLVTDRDGQPVEGARVQAKVFAMQRLSIQPWEEKAVLTDANGRFEYTFVEPEPDKSIRGRSRNVMIYKEGFAVGGLNLRAQPAQVRLWPMKPVAMRIVDAKGDPVAWAKVTIGTVRFVDTHFSAFVPAAIAESTAVTSRADGWAILKNTRPSHIQSVDVAIEGMGTQSFATEFHKTRFNVLQICETHKATLTVTRDGTPVKDWIVIAAEGYPSVQSRVDENRNPRNNHLLPSSIGFTGKTSNTGTLELGHVLSRREQIFVVVDDKMQFRGAPKCVFVPGIPATIDFKSLATEIGKSYPCKVQDVDTGEPISGAGIRFTTDSRELGVLISDKQQLTSDGRGIVNVKLIPAEWGIYCPKAPEGYCASIASAKKFTFTKDTKKGPPTIKLWKGKIIRGQIVDVDLTVLGRNWILIDWAFTNAAGGDPAYGTFDEAGKFEVVIPLAAKATGFKIMRHADHTGELQIKSKDPLELTLAD